MKKPKLRKQDKLKKSILAIGKRIENSLLFRAYEMANIEISKVKKPKLICKNCGKPLHYHECRSVISELIRG